METMPGSKEITPCHRLTCSKIWGGIKNQDLNVASASLKASLYSSACEGGKGGDIYFLSVCGHDVVTRLAIADVVGHGESVSKVSQWLYDSLQSHMNDMRVAGEDSILKDLNRIVAERGLAAMTTAVVAGVHRDQHNMYFVYAGHPPAMLCKRSGTTWEKIVSPSRAGLTDLPLGVERDADYTLKKVPVTIGDRIFLYTDGLLETKNGNGEQFGRAGLEAVLRETKTKDVEGVKSAVVERLRAYSGGNLSHDDVTLMAVEIL